MNQTEMKDSASFRDPSGYIFYEGNKIFRAISHSYKREYDHLVSSGLYEELFKKNLLIPHTEQDGNDDIYKVIIPEKIDCISYPCEWTFSQLKDAALTTLKVFNTALKYQMVIKDASAYNVQFYQGKACLIDTLSFEFLKENTPWMAYRQFVEHFICPLLLFAKVDERFLRIQTNFIDGIPVELVANALSFRDKLNPNVFIHIVLHARSKKKNQDKKIIEPSQSFNKNYYERLVDNLYSFVNSLQWKKKTTWDNYYADSTDEKYLSNKISLINKLAEDKVYEQIWDIGSNDGTFSKLFAAKGTTVLALDSDFSSLEKLYNDIKSNSIKNIVPLYMELGNPTPSYGWFNNERKSIFERSCPDLILALAVIHHLRISVGIPLDKQAQLFSSITHELIIEFVPKRDPKVVILLQNREDIFADYTESSFETIFGNYFVLKNKQPIPFSDRILYHFIQKDHL